VKGRTLTHLVVHLFAAVGALDGWLQMQQQQQQQQHGLLQGMRLLQAEAALWRMWAGIVGTARTMSAPAALLRIAHMAAGMLQPTLRILQQYLSSVSTPEPCLGGSSSSRSSSATAVGASASQLQEFMPGRVVCEAVSMQAAVLGFLHHVHQKGNDWAKGPGDSVASHPMQSVQMLLLLQQLHQHITSEPVAIAALQQLAACNQLLQQRQQQQQQQQQSGAGDGINSSSSSSSSRSSPAGLPEYQAATAAAAAASTSAALQTPAWVPPVFAHIKPAVASVGDAQARSSITTPLGTLQHVDQAGIRSAAIVLVSAIRELHSDLEGAEMISLQQRVSLLQHSPMVSSAALHLTLELQLLLSDELLALQQQQQPMEQQQRQLDGLEGRVCEVLCVICLLTRKQVRAALAVQAGSVQQLQQQSGLLLLRALAAPLFLARSRWLNQALAAEAMTSEEKGAGEQLLLLKGACGLHGDVNMWTAGGWAALMMSDIALIASIKLERDEPVLACARVQLT
jgi:hypothetical protein